MPRIKWSFFSQENHIQRELENILIMENQAYKLASVFLFDCKQQAQKKSTIKQTSTFVYTWETCGWGCWKHGWSWLVSVLWTGTDWQTEKLAPPLASTLCFTVHEAWPVPRHQLSGPYFLSIKWNEGNTNYPLGKSASYHPVGWGGRLGARLLPLQQQGTAGVQTRGHFFLFSLPLLVKGSQP